MTELKIVEDVVTGSFRHEFSISLFKVYFVCPMLYLDLYEVKDVSLNPEVLRAVPPELDCFFCHSFSILQTNTQDRCG